VLQRFIACARNENNSGAAMISEVEVKGLAVVQFLSRAHDRDWAALIGCLVDDGRCETAWVITGVARDTVTVAPDDAVSAIKSRSWSWLGAGTLLVPPDRLWVIDLIAQGRPANLVALDKAKERLRGFGFDPERLANVEDVARLDKVLGFAASSESVPSTDDRSAAYDIVMRAGQQKASLRIFQTWLDALELAADGHCEALGRLHLAVLLRHADRYNQALEVSAVLDGPDRFIHDNQRFIGMLACTRAACMLDVFERDRDPEWLMRAKRHLGRAWAIEQSEEGNAVYRRWRHLRDQWSDENPPDRTPLGARQQGRPSASG